MAIDLPTVIGRAATAFIAIRPGAEDAHSCGFSIAAPMVRSRSGKKTRNHPDRLIVELAHE